jgi:hypothetical protein
VLRWSPPDFWKATTWDVMRAQAGYLASKGVKAGNKPAQRKLSKEDVKRLTAFMERVEREDRERNELTRRTGSQDQG